MGESRKDALRVNFDRNLNWPLIGFALSVFIPSTAVVQKFLGSIGTGVYFIFASLTLLIGRRYVFTKFISKFTKKQALWLIAVTFLGCSFRFT